MLLLQQHLRADGGSVIIVAARKIAGIVNVIVIQQHERKPFLLQPSVIVRAFGRVIRIDEEPLHIHVQHFLHGIRFLAGVSVAPLHNQGIVTGRGHILGAFDDPDVGAVIMTLHIENQCDQTASHSRAPGGRHKCPLMLQSPDISFLRQFCQRSSDGNTAYVINFSVFRLCRQLVIRL